MKHLDTFKLKYKKEILIGLGAFILGALIIHIQDSQKINDSKKLINSIINNQSQIYLTDQLLYDNLAHAYDLSASCAENIGTCNLTEITNKMTQLNKEKEELQKQKQSFISSQSSINAELAKYK